MGAKLIISLDFELMWGVRDHRSVAEYGESVLGVRKALPAILDRFSAVGIRATWATVGLLFARNRDEMLDHAPTARPDYVNAKLSPYPAIINEIGRNEAEDPLHYGRSLVDRVLDTDGQEIATHTFSHYYCLEPGQTIEAFDADLKAARSISATAGVTPTSIVFPRNQMSLEHLACCLSNGITCFRGNPGGFAYRSRPGQENTLLVRGIRFLDGIIPVAGTHSFTEPIPLDGLINVPASRFMRPWSRKLPLYSSLHIDQVIREMAHAAKTDKLYHLWWHPHNMGRDREHNLAQLDRVIDAFQRLRDRFCMESVTMSESAEEAQASQDLGDTGVKKVKML